MPINQPVIDNDDVLRPTHIEVDLNAISHNYHTICAHVAPSTVMTVVKANAYGHGLVEIAQHLQALGSRYFGVAFLEEGIKLRKAGITAPILVMGGILGDQIPLFLDHDLTLTASSIEKLIHIEAQAKQRNKRARVHLKIDTGMERIGVHYYNAEKLFKAALNCEYCHIEGIYTHFARADEHDLSYTCLQLKRFLAVCDFYPRHNLPMPIRHTANSGAIAQLPETNLDMVRPGVMLYGVYPLSETRRTLALRSAMTWKSRVVYFKVIKPQHPVSYGSSWQSDTQTRLVTVPVGYGDGYFRSMSGKAQMLINGKRYPVVGRICMDQVMIDIGQDSTFNGDAVTILGGAAPNAITAEQLADWAGTITCEILTNINTRVPRLYL